MMFLRRQSKEYPTAEMKQLCERVVFLERKVKEDEQEIQELRSDLDMLVCLHTT